MPTRTDRPLQPLPCSPLQPRILVRPRTVRVAIHLGMFLVLAATAFGTPQAGDTLIVRGERHRVHGFELPPASLHRLATWRQKTREEKVWSNNWKGYFATLKIVDDALFLEHVEIDRGPGLLAVPLWVLFDSPTTSVRAAWFTGELVEYLGDPVGYTHTTHRVRVYRFKKGALAGVKQRSSR